jgi:hypothetical protein
LRMLVSCARRLPQPGCVGRSPWSTNPFCRGLRPSSSVVAPTGALRARRDHSMAISPKDTPERGRPCSVAVAIHRPLGSQRAPYPTLASLAKRRRNGTCALSVSMHRESQVTTLWRDRGLQEQEKCSLFGHTMRPRYGQGMAPGVCVPEASDRRPCGEVSTNRLCGRR